jgi:hypothetical protein
MIRSKGGLAKIINDTVQHDVYNTHCAAHKLELAAGHAFEKVDGFKNKLKNLLIQSTVSIITNLLNAKKHLWIRQNCWAKHFMH